MFFFREIYMHTHIQMYFRIMVCIMDIIIYSWSFIIETITAVQYASLMLLENYGFSPQEITRKYM